LRHREQWLRVAAELGHPEVAWKLAQAHKHKGLVADAVHYQRKALELGIVRASGCQREIICRSELARGRKNTATVRV
jgi:TPR repeat protein